MKDILDEVNDEYYQEKITNFLSKYILHLLSLIGIIILIIYIVISRNNSLDKENDIIENIYFKISTEENIANINPLLDKIFKNPKFIYSKLAGFKKANLLVEENKIDEAVKLYDILSKEKDDSIKYLAKLSKVSALIKYNKLDNLDKEIEEITSKHNPFYISGLFLKVDFLYNKKNYKEAKLVLDSIIMDENALYEAKDKAKKLQNSIAYLK